MNNQLRHSGESRNPGFLVPTGISKTFLPALAGVTCLLFVSGALFAADDALILQGKQAFVAHCVRCHGPDAKGDGVDAKRVPVVPRNLTEGVYKFQSTAQGTPPSDADLMWTLNHGLAGSGMPSFATLSQPIKESLVAYIKTLSPIFAEGQPEPLPAPNSKAKVNLQKGKEVYTLLQCALCHGENGRANGTSAFTLKDKWERPIKVADLTQGWTYRAGDSATQIYYRLMAGINGAPMPSYAEAVKSEDAWQLSKYVESLQLKANWKPEIHLVRLTGDLPQAPDDAVWKDAPQTQVNLQGSYYRNGRKESTSIHTVSVQAAANATGVSFRLSWNDPTKDAGARADSFLLGVRPASFKGRGTQNMHNLYFPGAEAIEGYYWDGGRTNEVRQMSGSLDDLTRTEARSGRALKAQSSYNDGAYTLVFQRPWSQPQAETWSETADKIYVGFAAWDASNDETGLKRPASQWIALLLKEPKSHH